MENSKSKIWIFLDSLTIFELANFYFYKYDTFLDHSRKEIDKYYLSKDITPNKIEILIKENKERFAFDIKDRCPRCYSQKRIKTSEYLVPANKYDGLVASISNRQTKINVEDWLVCGYKFPNRNRTVLEAENWLIQFVAYVRKRFKKL